MKLEGFANCQDSYVLCKNCFDKLPNQEKNQDYKAIYDIDETDNNLICDICFEVLDTIIIINNKGD